MQARRRLFLLLPLLAGLACTGAVVAQVLEIIELRNRPAEQLIPILAPLAGSGGSVTGSGFTLIVRAPAAQVAQIRQVVASLDRAPRQLLISVRQDLGGSMSSRGVGGQVILAPGGSGAQVGVYDRTGTAQDNVSQQVRTLEGNQAFVQTGTSSLVPQRTVTRTVGGTVVQESVVQRDLNTGVWVTPRVAGDSVTLEIATQRDTPIAGAGGMTGPAGMAATNRMVTSVSGRLGEWLDLGGVSTSQSSETRGMLARSSDAAAVERRVWVRVEEVR